MGSGVSSLGECGCLVHAEHLDSGSRVLRDTVREHWRNWSHRCTTTKIDFGKWNRAGHERERGVVQLYNPQMLAFDREDPSRLCQFCGMPARTPQKGREACISNLRNVIAQFEDRVGTVQGESMRGLYASKLAAVICCPDVPGCQLKSN
jgi:hypothetical protein